MTDPYVDYIVAMPRHLIDDPSKIVRLADLPDQRVLHLYRNTAIRAFQQDTQYNPQFVIDGEEHLRLENLRRMAQPIAQPAASSSSGTGIKVRPRDPDLGLMVAQLQRQIAPSLAPKPAQPVNPPKPVRPPPVRSRDRGFER
jgi:hypothetical protein